MPLISSADAIPLMRPHLGSIYDIVAASVSRYFEMSEADRITFNATTRACIIYCYMRDSAARYFVNQPGCGVAEVNQLFVFLIEPGGIALRFKKLGDDLASSNHESQQDLAFRNQEPLPGLAATHHLEAGYTLDVNGQRVSEVHLVCPNGPHSNLWAYKLGPDAALPRVQDLFTPKPPDNDPITYKRKKAPEEKNPPERNEDKS